MITKNAEANKNVQKPEYNNGPMRPKIDPKTPQKPFPGPMNPKK